MKKRHFHKYERFYWPSGKAYYRCMEDGCPHFLSVAEMAIGKESLCWGPECNNLVVITKEDIQKSIKHPMCEKCREERKENMEALRNLC